MKMSTSRLAFASALILLGFVASETALAQHRYRHHHRGGVALGFALGVPLGLAYAYRPYYYSPYYDPYYYPPAVTYTPPTYIEQGGPQATPAPQASPAPANYWYYCADSQSYYPYVGQCRGGWQRVSPTPG